jgi:hypothetical protein
VRAWGGKGRQDTLRHKDSRSMALRTIYGKVT